MTELERELYDQLAAEKAVRLKAEAACAELHNTVTMLVGGLHRDALNSPSIQKAVDHSRSCVCGSNFVPRAELEKAQSACAEMQAFFRFIHRNPFLAAYRTKIESFLANDFGGTASELKGGVVDDLKELRCNIDEADRDLLESIIKRVEASILPDFRKGYLSPEMAAKVRKALGVDKEWPVHDVLEQLALATEHLLKDHNCDTHGYEQYGWCVKLARQYIPQIKEVLALLDGKQ